jgi:hypothetical protein
MYGDLCQPLAHDAPRFSLAKYSYDLDGSYRFFREKDRLFLLALEFDVLVDVVRTEVRRSGSRVLNPPKLLVARAVI